jgi:hypothetical protein
MEESMPSRPQVTYGKLELHLTSDPEFTGKFGRRVKEAGGTHSGARGYRTTRYVTIPAAQTVLINELARKFGRSSKTVVVLRDLSAKGYSNSRIDQIAGTAPNIVFNWPGEEEAGPLSEFVRNEFEQRMNAINWAPILGRWSDEDECEARRTRAFDLKNEIDSLRERIASEAVRIAAPTTSNL